MTEMSFDGSSGSAQEQLAIAREELARQLEEACRTSIGGGAPETTGKLRKLDDALLAAARATEDMIALRQQARAEARAQSQGGSVAAPDREEGANVERIREFRDEQGEQWRVWAVTPGQASNTSPRNLGELRNGWLAFESLDGGAKRRLVDFPGNWMTLGDEELERLLNAATAAPVRKRSGGHDATMSD